MAESTVVQMLNRVAERNGLYIVSFLTFCYFFVKKKVDIISDIPEDNVDNQCEDLLQMSRPAN